MGFELQMMSLDTKLKENHDNPWFGAACICSRGNWTQPMLGITLYHSCIWVWRVSYFLLGRAMGFELQMMSLDTELKEHHDNPWFGAACICSRGNWTQPMLGITLYHPSSGYGAFLTSC